MPLKRCIFRHQPVIDDETAAHLEQLNLLTPPRNGKRTISTDQLTCIDVNLTEVPALLYSRQTYEFIGFCPMISLNLWRDFLCFPGSFIGKANAHLADTDIDNIAEASAGDWYRCLAILGINDETIEEIMHPKHLDLRRTRFCKDWANDKIEAMWLSIQLVGEALRQEVASMETGVRTHASNNFPE
ncbi:uncharacterized protein K452DRAFT_305179 [Aplosporella prunicola CBS 121167]|uniref:Uncharacterized protein n=1 Tax=Aplosporella prunicola CBS 121167 TaxID=1176127 RepID=A0A6A6BQD7_9PEZI|nr:uncharacterized protein K452DRAFT_305179 [Aplosporella prunicola CBS 121167]KAF2146220.1 hypothetical protein K452DRAFT_305179 [Aplosporella prunicola CBS 121167]